MIIKKYLHSCLLIEENGKKLLIDPGEYSFIEGKLKPEDIGPVDVIVYTHQHDDHFEPAVLKKMLSLKSATVVTHRQIGEMLQAEDIPYVSLEAGEKKTVEGFTIEAFSAPHEKVLGELPDNLAYLINHTLLHPGDSFAVQGVTMVPVLALPMTVPVWARVFDAFACAEKLQAQKIIPIHDVMYKDFALESLYTKATDYFQKKNVSFHPLRLGESLEVQ